MEEPTSETTLHCDSNELISDYFLKQTKSSRMSQWHKLLRKTRGIEVKLWKRSSEYPAISPDKRQFVCMQALQENERASERSNADTNLFLISNDDFAPFPLKHAFYSDFHSFKCFLFMAIKGFWGGSISVGVSRQFLLPLFPRLCFR